MKKHALSCLVLSADYVDYSFPICENLWIQKVIELFDAGAMGTATSGS